MRTVGQFKYVGITIIIYCQAKGEQEQQLCVCKAEACGRGGGVQLKRCAPSRQIARSAEHTVSLALPLYLPTPLPLLSSTSPQPD